MAQEKGQLIKFTARIVTGIALVAISLILLALSVPTLLANPKFTAYGYQGGDTQINQLLYLMMGGIMVLSAGLVFMLRGGTGSKS